MAETEMGRNWLRAMRKAASLTQPELAEQTGIQQSTISQLESGKRKLLRSHAELLAPVLKISIDELMANEADADELNSQDAAQLELDRSYKVAVTYVQCVGLVGAGWVDSAEPFDLDDDVQIPLVPGAYAEARQFGYRVVGNSMNAARIWDGDYVVCVPYWVARHGLANGDLVVIERHRGQLVERSVRQIVIGKTHIEFWPRSTDIRWQRPTVVLQRDMSAAELSEDDDTTVTVIGLVIWRGAPV